MSARLRRIWARRREEKIATAASTAISAPSTFLPSAPEILAPGIVASVPLHQRLATLAMQGYAPIVTVSKHRHGTKCRCGERVLRGVRHVCIYNAEHHLATLTGEERERLMWQLRALSVPSVPAPPPAKRKTRRKK